MERIHLLQVGLHFDETFEFEVSLVEMALLRFAVLDDEYIGDEFIGKLSHQITSDYYYFS